MGSLSVKGRQLRALKDLEATGLVQAVRRRIADQCLVCPPDEVPMLRVRAALLNDFLTELRALVNAGELKYDD